MTCLGKCFPSVAILLSVGKGRIISALAFHVLFDFLVSYQEISTGICRGQVNSDLSPQSVSLSNRQCFKLIV